jgi:hypothetical protein
MDGWTTGSILRRATTNPLSKCPAKLRTPSFRALEVAQFGRDEAGNQKAMKGKIPGLRVSYDKMRLPVAFDRLTNIIISITHCRHSRLVICWRELAG